MRIQLLALAMAVSSAWGEQIHVGSRVQSVTIADTGAPVVISTAKSPATVIVFVATRCPISNAYNDRMNAIYKEYSGKGVQFAFVNANSNEPREEVDRHAKANQFAFRVYKDTDGSLAEQFGAQVTPEAFVFDKDGVVQYHGYVDDATNEARVHVKGLRKAIDAVLSGQRWRRKRPKRSAAPLKRSGEIRDTTGPHSSACSFALALPGSPGSRG
jgi:Thiol-disulfide isomerase and thioredoxins